MEELVKNFCKNPTYEEYKKFNLKDQIFFGLSVQYLLRKGKLEDKLEKIYDLYLFGDMNLSYDNKRGIKSLIESIYFLKKNSKNKTMTIKIYSENDKKIVFNFNDNFFIAGKNKNEQFKESELKKFFLDNYSNDLIKKIIFYNRNSEDDYEINFYNHEKGIIFLKDDCYECYLKNKQNLLEISDENDEDEDNEEKIEEILYKLNCKKMLENNCFEKIRYKPKITN